MLSRRIEGYLQTIYELTAEKGYTRIKDIAERLRVKPASVSEMMQKLADRGYVIYEKRLFVALTEKGKKVAEDIRERREILIKFLVTIGVPKDIAEKDACIIEHALHCETVNQLKNFVKFIENSPEVDPKWLQHFREYCKTGIHPCSKSKVCN